MIHIGIVACSAEGAALCYRTICIEGAELMGAHSHPEVSMHTHSPGEPVGWAAKPSTLRDHKILPAGLRYA